MKLTVSTPLVYFLNDLQPCTWCEMFVCLHACLIVLSCALRAYVRALVGACVYEYNNVPSMRGFVCACLRA